MIDILDDFLSGAFNNRPDKAAVVIFEFEVVRDWDVWYCVVLAWVDTDSVVAFNGWVVNGWVVNGRVVSGLVVSGNVVNSWVVNGWVVSSWVVNGWEVPALCS